MFALLNKFKVFTVLQPLKYAAAVTHRHSIQNWPTLHHSRTCPFSHIDFTLIRVPTLNTVFRHLLKHSIHIAKSASRQDWKTMYFLSLIGETSGSLENKDKKTFLYESFGNVQQIKLRTFLLIDFMLHSTVNSWQGCDQNSTGSNLLFKATAAAFFLFTRTFSRF